MTLEPITLALEKIARAYFGVFAELVDGIAKALGIPISTARAIEPREIDARLAKIDAARHNLKDALEALNELTVEADKNRKEFASVSQELSAIQVAHAQQAQELERIKKVAHSDVSAVRRVLGIQNPLRERWIGFFAGIAASLLASAIWYGASLAIKAWGSD